MGNSKQYTLTEEEYTVLSYALQYAEDWLRGCDDEDRDKEADATEALNSEVEWQHTHGKRRPVQPRKKGKEQHADST